MLNNLPKKLFTREIIVENVNFNTGILNANISKYYMITAEFINKSTTSEYQKDTRVVINPTQGTSYIQVGDLDSDISFVFNFSNNQISVSGKAGTFNNNFLTRIIGCIPL